LSVHKERGIYRDGIRNTSHPKGKGESGSDPLEYGMPGRREAVWEGRERSKE